MLFKRRVSIVARIKVNKSPSKIVVNLADCNRAASFVSVLIQVDRRVNASKKKAKLNAKKVRTYCEPFFLWIEQLLLGDYKSATSCGINETYNEFMDHDRYNCFTPQQRYVYGYRCA